MRRWMLIAGLCLQLSACSCEFRPARAAEPLATAIARTVVMSSPRSTAAKVSSRTSRRLDSHIAQAAQAAQAERARREAVAARQTTVALGASVLDRLDDGAAVAAAGARWRLSMQGLPKATRQLLEGYWISAEPDKEHLDELWARGVRVVISASPLVPSMRAAIAARGFRHLYIPFGSRFPSPQRILAATAATAPEEILIHCAHGADRSGAVLAFLLVIRDHWDVGRALLAVALPESANIRALVRELRRNGVEVSEADVARYAGIYSAERNGHFGGLKAYGASYARLLHTTLAALHRLSAPIIAADASRALD